MEKIPLMNLDLCAPLFYGIADLSPHFPPNLAENEEILLCFDLDPAQSRSIEPDPQLLLGRLVFAAQKTGDSNIPQAETVSLPTGKYLFMQTRGALNREEWLNLAVEQQKDGLWERYKPENRLYVRFLHEDGCPVTQIFRPLSGTKL